MFNIEGLDIITEFPLILNVNITLELGTIVGLSAPNGSGKSTLMRTLTGLKKAEKGRAFITRDSQKITFYEAKKEIFYFESTNWFDTSLSGIDYLSLINNQWGASDNLIKESVDFWRMGSYINNPIKKYSLGMKQKLLLSLYYVSDAKYWFLDEPTLALDKESVKKLKVFFTNAKNAQKSLFFSAHENENFFEICDELYMIENRQILQHNKEITI